MNNRDVRSWVCNKKHGRHDTRKYRRRWGKVNLNLAGF